jgi:hypothetical protein
MSVWLDKPRRPPDGRQRASRRTTCNPLSKISLKFFPDLSRVWTVVPCSPDGHTLVARNFHIKASCIHTKGMVIRTVDQMHAISISVARVSGP